MYFKVEQNERTQISENALSVNTLLEHFTGDLQITGSLIAGTVVGRFMNGEDHFEVIAKPYTIEGENLNIVEVGFYRINNDMQDATLVNNPQTSSTTIKAVVQFCKQVILPHLKSIDGLVFRVEDNIPRQLEHYRYVLNREFKIHPLSSTRISWLVDKKHNTAEFVVLTRKLEAAKDDVINILRKHIHDTPGKIEIRE